MFLSKEIDEKLIMAFELYNQKLCESLPDDEELKDITFSEEFENKMQKLIRAQKKSYYYMINTVGKRVAIIVLAIIISLTATTFSVKALREVVLDFITQIFDTHTEVTVTDGNLPMTPEFVKTQPQYVPNGFEIKVNEDYDEACRIVYRNSDGVSINYMQQINGGSPMSTDTEGVTFETIKINSLEGIIYNNKDVNKIVFGNDEYFFTLRSDISMDELIKMAESIPIE